MNKLWIKISVTVWPAVIIILSGVFLNRVPFFPMGILALLPPWWYVFIRKEEDR